MNNRFDRCEKLFGNDFKKIQNTKILILGVGGVGGFCLDCLYKTGVKKITIVDNDIFDITNQNRQIGAENVGAVKVETLAKKYLGVTPLIKKIDEKWCKEFDFGKFDIVIDAIDDMKAKVALVNNISLATPKPYLISSMGSAKKLNPTKIKATSIWKTHTDKLAKKFRYELKKSGFKGDFLVIFSDEEAKCQEMGSFIGVTGTFGLTLCASTIKQIISKKTTNISKHI